ncbi:MAG: protein kinase [Acidobacteria bacterium]|nr:protein kinase [Acidobacteriota bacterium]
MQPEYDPFGYGSEANKPPGGYTVGNILHGRFLIEEDLSDAALGGGFAAIRAKDLKEYCREVVLKISIPSPDRLDAEGPSLVEVATGLKRLSHPNIEEFLESGRFPDGRPFAVSPFYSAAMRLDQLANPEKRLELAAIGQLVEQISDGMGAAHSKGILHCDLRPANILVPEGEIGTNAIKIVNFGSGWPVDCRGESLNRLPPGAESLHYAAPELLVALGHRSPASDVYSLAVLVYRMVTGGVPFSGNERKSQLTAINDGSPEPPGNERTDLSAHATELILAGLQFEPALRPQNMQDYGLRLANALDPPRGIIVQTEPAAADSYPEPAELEPAPIVDPEPAPLFEAYIAKAVEQTHLAPRPAISGRTLAWVLIILLVVGSLSIPIVQAVLKNGPPPARIEPKTVRAMSKDVNFRLKYWLEAGPASHQYPTGDGAADHLALAASAHGEAYVLDEFTGDDGRPAYRLVFPAPGSVTIEAEAGKATRADLGPSAGLIWIVWTTATDNDLRSIVASAARDGYISNDESRRRLRHFLERNRNLGVTERSDPATGQTLLEGSTGKIVYRLDLREGRSRPPTTDRSVEGHLVPPMQ